MRKIIYYAAQLILFLNVAFSCFVIINISDLIKYTTDTEDGVPYGDTNYYLYRAIWIGVCVVTIVLMMILSYCKNRFIKKMIKN